jgi:hypothetical protein
MYFLYTSLGAPAHAAKSLARLVMAGLDPAIQGNKRRCLLLWMARIRWRYAPEAGHGES